MRTEITGTAARASRLAPLALAFAVGAATAIGCYVAWDRHRLADRLSESFDRQAPALADVHFALSELEAIDEAGSLPTASVVQLVTRPFTSPQIERERRALFARLWSDPAVREFLDQPTSANAAYVEAIVAPFRVTLATRGDPALLRSTIRAGVDGEIFTWGCTLWRESVHSCSKRPESWERVVDEPWVVASEHHRRASIAR